MYFADYGERLHNVNTIGVDTAESGDKKLGSLTYEVSTYHLSKRKLEETRPRAPPGLGVVRMDCLGCFESRNTTRGWGVVCVGGGEGIFFKQLTNPHFFFARRCFPCNFRKCS